MWNHINSFFDKQDSRKSHLYILLKNGPKEGICINEIVENQGTSRKTALSDINELSLDLLKIYGEKIIKKNMRMVVNVEKVSSEIPLFLYYFKRSCKFKIVDAHVMYPSISRMELKGKLYYSDSKIYNTYKSLNTIIKPLGLYFGSNGLSGDEHIIRNFIVELYWCAFGEWYWPFNKHQNNFLTEIKLLEQEWGSFVKTEIDKSTYWLYITELRIKNGYVIHEEKPKLLSPNPIIGSFENFIGKSMQKTKKEIIKGENNFLEHTISVILKIPTDWENPDISNNFKKNFEIEKFLLEKGGEQSWSPLIMRHYRSNLEKIRYYIQEGLMKWYHFLEPNAKKNWNSIGHLLIPEIKEVLVGVSDEISSAYIYASQILGLFLSVPLRVGIQDREENTAQVIQLFTRWSKYPVLLVDHKSEKYDILLTEFFKDNSCTLKENKKFSFFYEFPLTEEKISMLIHERLRKMNSNTN